MFKENLADQNCVNNNRLYEQILGCMMNFKENKYLFRVAFGVLGVLFISSCTETRTMNVTATAYNSVEAQTKKGDSLTTAWGETLEPGTKVIAVSRDLIQEGLDYDTKVKIEGLEGTYRVVDKMNKRWEKRIDIYMGDQIEEAREWGKQEVTITWEVDG